MYICFFFVFISNVIYINCSFDIIIVNTTHSTACILLTYHFYAKVNVYLKINFILTHITYSRRIFILFCLNLIRI